MIPLNAARMLGGLTSGMISGRRRSSLGVLGGLGMLMEILSGPDEEERFRQWDKRQGNDMPQVQQTESRESYTGPSRSHSMSPSKLNTDTPSVEESETTDIPPPPLPIENQTASTSHFDHLETSGIELPAPPPLPDGTGMDEIDDSFISFLEVGGEDVESSVGVRAMRAMIAAAYADGELQDEEREIIEGRLDNLPDNEAEFIRAELCDPKPVSTFAKGVVNKRDKKLIFGLAVAVLKADGKAMKGETEFARELAKTLGLSNSEAKEIIEKVS